MPTRVPLPRLSRVAFFRFNEGELISSLAQAIVAHIEQNPGAELTANHEALYAWARMLIDVPNGGFEQFFYNHRGECGVASLADLFDSLEVPKAGCLLRDAVVIYHKHRQKFTVECPWDGLFGQIKEFDKLEETFANIVLRSNRALDKWIRSHIAELANDETGNPIDPQFTGSVEIMQANGLVGEYLEVKKGKPNGAYREFFDDGTVRKVVFYKSGKVSGDFWPNGCLKRKESKRGNQVVIEWFFSSGRLQKHLVKDKDDGFVEPIRRFHENGQVAEEITCKGRKKCGPWLKYFEDGSPQLEAEYVDDEKLIVHNAWNEDRVQVAEDGTGVFYDDGQHIAWEYSVFSKSMWQHEMELKGGIPHGKVTTHSDGMLWSISEYKNGVREGKNTLFYDNGRVRSVYQYVHGEQTACESYPKFDEPQPAVILKIEANEELYTAWEHIVVDEYPRVLNLDEVQQQLPIPDFLREVCERNLAQAIKSDYEDWNTFRDGIAYFLSVNETGEVTIAHANGSSAYSGGSWGIYPPFLMKLRFEPGRIRGRAVECRVLACVDHTFVEGKTE